MAKTMSNANATKKKEVKEVKETVKEETVIIEDVVTEDAEDVEDVISDKIEEKKEVKVEPKVESNSELDALKKQVEMLQALLLANSKLATTNQTSQFDDGYIRGDKGIQIMSLTPNLLNVSTLGNGKGKIYKFPKYGEVKTINYSDVADIITHNQSFAENGKFYIFDKDVIRRHGLESAYEKILDKTGIDTFLEKSVAEIKEIFKELPNSQKEAIVASIIDKIVAGEDVSTNKVNVIKEMYGEDIFAKADEMQNWEKEVEELSK